MLDGRVRDQANKELGKPREAINFEETPQGITAASLGDKELMHRAAADYLIAKNLERKHYTQGQLAMIGARMPYREEGRPKKHPSAGEFLRSEAEIAALVGVSTGLLSNAKRILREGTARQIKAAENGSPIEPIVMDIKREERARKKTEMMIERTTVSASDNSQIICGDALAVLRTLPDQCVATCVSSPPYFGLRDYQMEGQIGLEETPGLYVSRLVAVFREVRRVLKDDGTFWLVIGDSYTAANNCAPPPQTIGGQRAMPLTVRGNRREQEGLKPKDLIGIPWTLALALRNDGWYWRDTIIWHKPNPMPESVKDRTTKAHEYILMFAKKASYYYDNNAIQEEAISVLALRDKLAEGYQADYPNSGRMSVGGTRRIKNYRPNDTNGLDNDYTVSSTKNKRSVWTVNVQPYAGDHYAAFPPNLVKPCILAGSRKGDVVLDPFFGTGTIGLVAKRYGRNYIGIELNPNYVRLAEQRISEIAHEEGVCAEDHTIRS